MNTFIVWVSFLGSWLLFAGPIYQASLELNDEDIERERIQSVAQNTPRPPRVSRLWWFLPPVKIYLEQKRSRRYRETYLKALLPEDAEAMVGFMNKTVGWLMVALGGLLLAIAETYELCEAYRLGIIIFILIALALFFLSIIYTVWGARWSQDIISGSNQNN